MEARTGDKRRMGDIGTVLIKNTKVFQISEEDVNSREAEALLEEAGQIVREGGLVAFPTETVYGLGGDGLNADSSRKIYAAKGRPSDNPLIVHIADRSDLTKIVKEIPAKAELLMEAFWPGPLTMIFPKSDIVPDATTGGLDTVAVRFPSDKVAQQLILKGGRYIAAPSANLSGRPSPTKASHVIEDLAGAIDVIIDGGSSTLGLESTIVDVSVEPPMILRPGFITMEMLQEVLGEVTMDRALIDPDSGIKPKAPGMKYRHYAPRAQMVLVEGEAQTVTDKINAFAEEELKDGKKIGVITTEERKEDYPGCQVFSVGSRKNPAEVAAHLYAILREFDESDVDKIYSEVFDEHGIGAAVMNRLMKAAGQQIVHL